MTIELELFHPEQTLPDEDTTVLLYLVTGETEVAFLDSGSWTGETSGGIIPDALVVAWSHLPELNLAAPVTFPELIDRICQI